MSTPTREVQTQDSLKKTRKEPKSRKLQVKGAKKGQERQSKVENTNKVIVIKEEAERNHVAQGPQSDMKNDKGKNVDKGMDLSSFLSFVPRRKLPFMSNDDKAKDHCLTGTESRRLEDALRGPLGYQAVFVPSPDQSPFWPAGGTPPVLAHPPRSSQSESGRSSARAKRSSMISVKPIQDQE